MPKLNISTLAVEVTRRCNMCCPHCLRRGPEDLDMRKEYMEKLLSQVDSIYTVAFTGGEPSLNIQCIRDFYEIAERYGCVPQSFYVVTNGKENQKELALLLMEKYLDADDKEMCGVALSIDAFHEKIADGSVRALACYKDDKEHDPSDTDWPLHAGRAQDNGIGRNFYTERCENPKFQLEEAYNGNIAVDELYLAADGWCHADCDLAYDTMERLAEEDKSFPVDTVSNDLARLLAAEEEEED